MSPSSSVTGRPPISISLTISALAMVDLPEPEKPVKNTVKPCLARGGRVRRSSCTTSGKENHSGISSPSAQAPAQLGAGDVEHGHALLDLVRRLVLGALLDVDHVLEIDHLDADLVLVLAEQILGVVGAVEILAGRVLARARMVAPDDEMGAAVVLADQRVPDRLARAGHAHGEVQQAHRGGGGGVLVEHRLVAAHPGEVVDVARLGQAHHRVDQQVGLGFLGGAEGQLLVGAVQRVAGLEGDDLAPAELAEIGAQLVRRVAAAAEIVMRRRLDAGDRAAEIDLAGGVVQVVDRRVGVVVGAEDLSRPRAPCPASSCR